MVGNEVLPRIFAVCLVKNEADVIGLCLERAEKWAHRIIVFDNGSTDGTWDIVRRHARQSDRVVAWKQSSAPFKDGLRSEPFEAFRCESRPGDWWYRLDADEFPVCDPREVLSTLDPRFTVVFGLTVEYYLTPEDLYRIDFSEPIETVLSQVRHYRIENQEVRGFMYRPRLRWPATDPWPRHMGLVAPTRLLIRHYKYRSPAQIEKRVAVRLAAVNEGYVGWWQEYPADWRENLADPSTCAIDDGLTPLQCDSRILGRGSAHIERGWKAMAKRVLHGVRVWP